MNKKEILLEKVKDAVNKNENLLTEIAEEKLELFTNIYQHTCIDFDEYYNCSEEDGKILEDAWNRSFCILEAFGITKEDVRKYAYEEFESIVFNKKEKGKTSTRTYPGKFKKDKVLVVSYGPDTYITLLDNIIDSLSGFSNIDEATAEFFECRYGRSNAYYILVSVLDDFCIPVDEIWEVAASDPMVKVDSFYIERSVFCQFKEMYEKKGYTVEDALIRFMEESVGIPEKTEY